jgi:predicted DNA-binding transcriptional regulator AlpA
MTSVPPARPPLRRADLLTLADVLAELDVPKSTFFRWKATGKAPRTIKYPNGSLRVRRRDLDAWLADHEEAAAA